MRGHENDRGKASGRRLAGAAGLAGRAALALAGAAMLATSVIPGAAQGASRGRSVAFPGRAGSGAPGGMRAACGPVSPGRARCMAVYRPQAGVNRALAVGDAVTPAGLTPANLRSAYQLPSGRNPHQTVAVVDAFDTPKLAQYVATYRHQFGISQCGASCLRKVNQAGKKAPLAASGVRTGWDLETVLDADMISAACPQCKILVVEARSASIADLAAAAATAARLGARVISNSYGGQETGQGMTMAHDYHRPGHVFVASSGDFGFRAANLPASLATVTAVGGTQLTKAPGTRRGWTEKAWNEQGDATASGCSAYVRKPAWQHDAHCHMRTVADVSAAAAHLAIYEKEYGGWLTVGGTSAAAPLIAAVYALAGNAATVTARFSYEHAKSLNDVTAGNNDLNVSTGGGGKDCGRDYLCVAKKGYDAPTGLGTPHGTGAF